MMSGEAAGDPGARAQAVALEVLAGHGGRLRVNGSSMAPCLRPGDEVVFAPAPLESLRRGDLLVARRPADLVTHRLLWMDAAGVHLKGDAAWQPDPPFTPGEILGRVTAVRRGDRRWDYTRRRWQALNRWLGWVGHSQVALLHFLGRI